MSDEDYCPGCGQHIEDGRGFNWFACGHEWHGSEDINGPGEDPEEPPVGLTATQFRDLWAGAMGWKARRADGSDPYGDVHDGISFDPSLPLSGPRAERGDLG